MSILSAAVLLTLTSFGCFALDESCGDTTCYHGDCVAGACVCHDCYTGSTCAIMKNTGPKFLKDAYQVSVLPGLQKGGLITKVMAEDDDVCLNRDCPCKKLIFSITNSDLFDVNRNTGEISLIQNGPLSGPYNFIVKVTNADPFDNKYDLTTVYINFGGGSDESDKPLERHKRQTPTYPSTLTFQLVQTFPAFNVTSITIGQRMTFQLTITFPNAANSLTVESFAPDTTNTAAMMLCSYSILSQGAGVSGTVGSPYVEGKNGALWPYIRLVYNFTNMLATGFPNSLLSDIQVVIQFDCIMIYSNETVAGTTYYVSSGSEYLQGQQIWVGQSGYAANLTTPTPNPNITIIGDQQIYPGRTAAFDLVIQATDAYVGQNLQIFTPLNDTTIMNLCIVNRYVVGAAFGCLPTTFNQPTINTTVINNQNYYLSATQTLGVLTNIYYMEMSNYPNISTFTIQYKIVARINPNALIGLNYYIGASIGYNTQSIWAGKGPLPVVAQPALIPYTTQIPFTLSISPQSSNPAPIGGILSFLVSFALPVATELDYTVQVVSVGDKAEVCGFTIYSVGANVPCSNMITPTTLFNVTSDGYATQNQATFPAIRQIQVSSNANDNNIVVSVQARPINDSRNSAGATITFGVTLNWTGNAAATQTIPIQLTSTYSTGSLNTTDLPQFQFDMYGASGNLAVSDSANLRLIVTADPGVIYSPASIQIFMPINNSVPGMSICSASVVRVGSNVLCFNPTFINSKFLYSSRSSTGINDTVTLNVGSICSGAQYGTTPSVNDQIEIKISILVLNQPQNTAGAIFYINAGMLVTNTQIWVGNQQVTILGTQTLTTLNSMNTPYLMASRTDSSSTSIYANDMAIIQYIIKISPSTRTQLSLKVYTDITTTDYFGVCYMRIILAGNAMPCNMTPTVTSTTWNPLSKFNKQSIMSFGTIVNNGIYPFTTSPSFDDNSIIVEVAVRFGSTLPTTFNVLAQLLNAGTQIATNAIPLYWNPTPVRINGTQANTQPTFNMYLLPLLSNNYVPINSVGFGETLRAITNITVQPGVLQSLAMVYASRYFVVNQMDVLSVNILSVGRNIPCLQPGMVLGSPMQRSASLSSDMINFNLGTICQKNMVTNPLPQDNVITLETLFRVWKNPVALTSSNLEINCLALVNNDQIYVSKILFNVSATSDHITDVQSNMTSVTTSAVTLSPSVSIGSTFALNFTVYLPPYTQYNSAKIYIPPLRSGDCSFLSGYDLQFFITSGSNIGFNVNERFNLILTSSTNTSQLDSIVADLGVLQNSGEAYKMMNANFSVLNSLDSFTFQFKLRVADNVAAVNNYVLNIPVTFIFGSIYNNTVNVSLTLLRTGSETISIQSTTQLLTNQTIYGPGDPITLSVFAQLVNGSSLECRNFLVIIAVPQFIGFVSIANSTYTSPGYSVQQTSLSNGGYQLTVPYFFFNETLYVVFTISVKQGVPLSKSRITSILTIPIIYTCKTQNVPPNPLSSKWIDRLDPVVINVKGSDVIISNCNTNLNLTDPNTINDCAITAFMAPFVGFEPQKVRSNSGSYWKPHTRGGAFTKLRYISILFTTLMQVSKIMVTCTVSNYPTTLDIYGTMDRRSYSFYQTLSIGFVGNIGNVTLSNPNFVYRGIRIAISATTMNDSDTGINIDLFGCTANATDPVITNVCSYQSYSTPPTQLPEYYARGYVYQTPYLFVCDEVPTLDNPTKTIPKCFRTNASSPTTWRDMGQYIGKVIGYDSTKNQIYGIASDLKSYVFSADDGLTWSALNRGGWIMTNNLNSFSAPVAIPWTTSTGFIPGTCSQYSAGTWTFCYDGVYSSSALSFSWNSCC